MDDVVEYAPIGRILYVQERELWGPVGRLWWKS